MIVIGKINRHDFGRPMWRDGQDFSDCHKNLTHVIRRTFEYTFFDNENVSYETHSENRWHENRLFLGWKWYAMRHNVYIKRTTWSISHRYSCFNADNIPAFLFDE